MLKIKRVYTGKEETDGYRVLVDRIWPRGMTKELAQVDLWLKDVAPSKELRQFFNHEKEKFPEFKKKYQEELKQGLQKEALNTLKEIINTHDVVTIVYGAKNETYNQAVVLKELLEK